MLLPLRHVISFFTCISKNKKEDLVLTMQYISKPIYDMNKA